jgi:DNA polymerase I-like protein with 3'-5' exonuclease and polymerase domains
MNYTIHTDYKPDLLLQLLDGPNAHYWVMDTETDGLDVLGSGSRNTAHYIGLMPMTRKKEIIPHVFIIRGEDWNLYREKVERDIILVGHNLRFDLHATDTFPNLATYDTMVMAYHASTTSRHGMDHMCAVRGWPKIKTPDLIKKGRILECPEEDIVRYLADDVYTTARLFKDVRESGSDWKTERAVHRMESRGLLLLPDKLAQVAAEVDQLVDTSYGWLVEAGWPQAGNLNSPAQVSEWLTERGRKLPLSKTGKPSTNKVALQQMADRGDELVTRLLDYRKAVKLRSSFVETLPQHADADNMIYPRTNTTRTATGRFSCDTPNMQQIPKRGLIGKALRGCFTGPSGNGITGCDFNQVELRVAAAFANEEVLLEAFKAGRCPHTEVAAKIHGKTPDQVTPLERYGAKAVNFGILNGMGAKRLSLEIKSDKATAQRFLDDYKRNLPSLHEWMEGVWRESETFRIARTVDGRTRCFSQQEETRPAISVIVQGSAAELMRKALYAVDVNDLTPVLSVHDEILIDGADRARADFLKEVMESAANEAYPDAFSSVEFKAEADTGATWGDL